VGTLWRAIPDWVAARDPGLARLSLATRGTISVVLSTLAAMLAARVLHVPIVEFASGITYSLMGPFLTREPTLRQRQWGLLILVLPAMAATVATAVLHGAGPAGDSFFLVLVFLCFLLHPRNPRAIGIGLVAVVITYVGLYLELPPATLPSQLGSIVAALPITAFACFVIVPVNPAATLRLAVRAVRWRAVRALHSASGASDAAGVQRLRRDLVRLSEATLAADDQLAVLQPIGREAVRAGLISLELTTARLINALRTERVRPRHGLRLALHERRMRMGRPYTMDPGMLEPGTLRATLVEMGHQVHGLGVAAAAMRTATTGAPASAPLPPGPLGWRLATRVTLAAALAMAGGMALSPQRWFWAVITVYLVFLNTRSRGDAIYRGVQRVAGTLFGMASGLVLATVLADQESLQTGALLLSLFGMYYFITTSYTAGIFCVTVLLGLLYGMLGASLETLLVLRLEETAIGALAAVLVAAFVMPQSTRAQVMRSGHGVLAALLGAVRASRAVLEGTGPDAAPLAAMRQVDRQVADLRTALAPLTVGRTLLRRTAVERPVPALLECVHWTRVLSVGCRGAGSAMASQAAAVEQRLAALAAHDPVPPAEPIDDGSEVGVALAQLNAAVDVLSERLEIGALEGFGLA
jgi:uncharacterized membrane protein YccC